MSWEELEERFGGHHWDRDGAPISFRRWGELRGQLGYVRVAEDRAGPYVVVTNWLGQPATITNGARPDIFETYTVRAANNETVRRRTYATEPQALAGHRQIVLAARIARGLLVALLAVVIALAVGVAVWVVR